MMAFVLRVLVLLSVVAHGMWCVPSEEKSVSEKRVGGSGRGILSRLRAGVSERSSSVGAGGEAWNADLSEQDSARELTEEGSISDFGDGLELLEEVSSVGASVRRVVEHIETDNSADAVKLRKAIKDVALKFIQATESGFALGAAEASRGAKALRDSVALAAVGISEQLRGLQASLKKYVDSHPQLKDDLMAIGTDTIRSLKRYTAAAKEASKTATDQLLLGADFLQNLIQDVASAAAKAAANGKEAIQSSAKKISNSFGESLMGPDM